MVIINSISDININKIFLFRIFWDAETGMPDAECFGLGFKRAMKVVNILINII
jgi:hypothetical protein